MGLDVYMYRLEDGVTREQFEAARKAHDDAEEALYSDGYSDGYSELTDEQKEQKRQEIKESAPDPEGEYNFAAIKEGGEKRIGPVLAKEIEIPSQADPES